MRRKKKITIELRRGKDYKVVPRRMVLQKPKVQSTKGKKAYKRDKSWRRDLDS